MRKAFGITLLVAVVIAAGATGYLFLIDRPMPPMTLAGELAFARTTIQEPSPFESLPPWADSWTVASDCPSRVTSGAAYVDLCWVATRQRDEDPSQDFFTLHVGGTFGGGARWLIVEAHPLDAGPLLRTDGRPDGRTTGCQSMDYDEVPSYNEVPSVSNEARDLLCGRFDAGPGAYAGVWHVNWACELCVPWEVPDRPIQVRLQVVVEEGTLPNWDLYAGVGR